MIKFISEYKNLYNQDIVEKKVCIEIPSDSCRDDLIESFTDFLKACGYPTDQDSRLEWINEEKEVILDYSEYKALLANQIDKREDLELSDKDFDYMLKKEQELSDIN